MLRADSTAPQAQGAPLQQRLRAAVRGLRSAAAQHLPAWPSQCPVCRSWCSGGVCEACLQRFAAPRPRCAVCALPLPGGWTTPRCGECLADPPPFTTTVCGLDYVFPWDRLVAALKYQGRPELARVLAQRLIAALDAANAPPPQWVLPVPLAPERLASRGYNQAWELARRVAAARTLPAHPGLLQRAVHTPRQAELGRAARQRNLRGVFCVPAQHRATIAGQRLALVDDVMTTGATVREAAACLLQAGAAEVQVWVVARTPAPADRG